MAAYSSPHDSQFFTRRAITFAVAVGVQVLIVALFASGLANRVISVVAPPIQTDIVQEVQKRDTPPPPPPPKMEHPPVEVPPPDVAINVPVETNSTAITNVTTKHVVKAPPPPPPRKVVRTYARLDTSHSPPTDDYYPPTSKRLGEQGTAVVDTCFGPTGRVDGVPKVQTSSGSSRLDDAAVKWASHARAIPATVDGKPVAGCVPFRVKFVLTD